MMKLIYFLRIYGMRNKDIHIHMETPHSILGFELCPSVFCAHTHHSCQTHLTSELMTFLTTIYVRHIPIQHLS